MGIFDESKMVDARRFSGNAKASIQNNGRLGFSADAARILNLESEKRLLVSDIGDGNLAVIIGEKDDERGFRIQKGGDYFYTKMKSFFDSQEVEYTQKRVIYDISETKERFNDTPVFRLTKRVIDKKDTDEDNE